MTAHAYSPTCLCRTCARERLARARILAADQEARRKIEQRARDERRERGTRLLRARLRLVLHAAAVEHARISVETVYQRLSETVVGLTRAHTRRLLHEAGLTLDGNIVVSDDRLAAYLREPD